MYVKGYDQTNFCDIWEGDFFRADMGVAAIDLKLSNELAASQQ